jgi:murein DD-endopeptidase MepM/ murein hydrolase activator NlpD
MTPLLALLVLVLVSVAGVAQAATTTTTEEATTAPEQTTTMEPATTTEDPDASVEPSDGSSDSGGATNTGTSADRGGRVRVKRANTKPTKAFIYGKRKASFAFEIGGNSREDIVVKVRKLSTGKTAQRWRFHNVRPGERRSLTWGGRTLKGGYTTQGKHAFTVYKAGGEKADMSSADGHQRVRMYGARFPLRGPHQYGDGFGAGRGHQGQDVFAKCGTPIVAARGGRVQTKAFQSSAGYYVVIDGKGTGQDLVYMHMQKRGRPGNGERVRTGERIGYESDTGNASGCHLHFEMWTKPGWYEGGHAVSPTRALKKWDGWS